MISITPEFAYFLKRHGQEWIVKVDINGVEYGMDSIVDFEVMNDVSGSDEFLLGTANISKLTLTMRTYDEIPPNARIVPYVSLSLAGMAWDEADYSWDGADFAWDGSSTTEWLSLGVFYVDNREQIHDILVLDCLDGLVYADIAYVSQLDYPTTMQTVWDEVCAQTGLLYDSSVQIDPAHTLNAGPADYTCRQVMSYIAGVHGASVKMSRAGEVSWRTYTADESPVYEMTEADYIRVKQTNPIKSYTRVVVTYDEDDQLTYEAGEGDDNHTLYLTNPLMTQAMTDALLEQISGFAYMPIQMDARGYPQLEHGDRISFERSESLSWQDADVAWDDADFRWDGIETYQTVILQQTFTFRGGLKMAIDAPSVSEQESEFGIDGTLTAAVKRLNENAVRFDKAYHGVTHSREHGIVTQRTDGTKSLTINSDVLLDWVVDGERKLYYDDNDDAIKFSGIINASRFLGGDIEIGSGNNVFKADSRGVWAGHSNYVDAPFYVNMSGQLFATDANISGIITSATINGGSIVGASINGGVITGGTIQTASAGVFPRAVLDPTTREMTFYNSINQWVRLGAFGGAGGPFIQFVDANGEVFITKTGEYINVWGSFQADKIRIDYANLINGSTGSNFWTYYSTLQTMIAGKQDAFTGLNGYYPMGGTSTGRFLNGVLVEVI